MISLVHFSPERLHKERDSKEKDNVSISESSNNEEEEEGYFFSNVIQTKERVKGHKSLENKAQNLARTWLDSKDSFTDAAFLGEPVLIELFIKYNTAIPSSAAVERLFSTGKDVLRAKRSLLLSDDNFNMLMSMKGNMHLIQNNDQ